MNLGKLLKGNPTRPQKNQEVGQFQNSHSQGSDFRVILTAILGHVPKFGPEYIEKGRAHSLKQNLRFAKWGNKERVAYYFQSKGYYRSGLKLQGFFV